jgi:carbon storage regulator
VEGITMLVLSRKKNESVVINDNITVVVVDVRGDKVRLGIDAPKDIPVHRKEIHDMIRKSNVNKKTTVHVH